MNMEMYGRTSAVDFASFERHMLFKCISLHYHASFFLFRCNRKYRCAYEMVKNHDQCFVIYPLMTYSVLMNQCIICIKIENKISIYRIAKKFKTMTSLLVQTYHDCPQQIYKCFQVASKQIMTCCTSKARDFIGEHCSSSKLIPLKLPTKSSFSFTSDNTALSFAVHLEQAINRL